MAKKIITLLEDDISGGDADETVLFGLDGTSYEIDLNEKNATKLRAALETYVAHGRRVSGSAGRRGKRTTPTGVTAGEIREWALSQGLDVPARGRVPAAVREAYDAAH